MTIDSRRFQTTKTRRGDVVPSRGNFTKKGTTESYPAHEGVVRRMQPSLNRAPAAGTATLSGAPFKDAAPGATNPPKSGKNKKVPQADLASAARRKLGM